MIKLAVCQIKTLTDREATMARAAEMPVVAVVGPEFVTGSTRMKAGTATKLILNMISTAAMIRLGHVTGSKMVDMELTNSKLVDRGARMIMDATGITDYEQARALLLRHGHVRVDGQKVNIPSCKLKPGQVVEVRDNSKSREYAKPHLDAAESRGYPAWLAVDKSAGKAEILHVPTREEMAPVVDEQLIVELYSR